MAFSYTLSSAVMCAIAAGVQDSMSSYDQLVWTPPKDKRSWGIAAGLREFGRPSNSKHDREC